LPFLKIPGSLFREKPSAFNVNDQPFVFYIVKDGAVGLSISYDEKKFLSINVMKAIF
jgi:hypothetical protein